jgi:hypothetical protein
MATQMAALRDLTRYRLGFRIAVAAATIGAIYGYDLGNISGALLFIDKELDLLTKQTEWVATIVVAGSMSLVWLDSARFFLGVTIGVSIVTAPIFVAESAPAAVRGGLIVMYFLSALEALGGAATFAMFAALALVAFAFVWWLAPETKGRPLEAIRAYWENGGRWPAPAAGEPRFTRTEAPAAEAGRPRRTTRTGAP